MMLGTFHFLLVMQIMVATTEKNSVANMRISDGKDDPATIPVKPKLQDRQNTSIHISFQKSNVVELSVSDASFC